MIKQIRFIFSILCAASVSTFTVTYAQAAERKVEVAVNMSGEVSQAVGLLLTAEGTREKRETQVRRQNEHTVVVSFSFDESEADEYTSASAVVKDKEGAMSFGNMVGLRNKLAVNGYVSIPDCQTVTFIPVTAQDQLANLQALVEIRSQRRTLAKAKIGAALQGSLLEKLKKLEKSFGFESTPALSADLHPVDLIGRLGKIQASIRNYEAHKVKQ